MSGYVTRSIEKAVREDLERKMVLVGGPRQCGKTTMALSVAGLDPSRQTPPGQSYLNWDSAQDRRLIRAEQFPTGVSTVVLDEIHKYSRWRQVVKGLFDKRGPHLRIMVTGSARLDHYRRGGDSLQGRYHYHRLFPFTCAELGGTEDCLRDLFAYGPFPEPLLGGSHTRARRWSRDYHSRVIREDLRDLQQVRDVALVERLVERLPSMVGSPLSLNSLREDLDVAHLTVSRWVQMLETLYLVFRIYPFGSPRVRAVKKEAKHYHYDWNVVSDPGARFENMIACHLWNWCCARQDREGADVELRYFRDTDRREVDFVLMESGAPRRFIECKLSGRDCSAHLRYLHEKFPEVPAVQVCLEQAPDVTTRDGIRLCSALELLRELA